MESGGGGEKGKDGDLRVGGWGVGGGRDRWREGGGGGREIGMVGGGGGVTD